MRVRLCSWRLPGVASITLLAAMAHGAEPVPRLVITADQKSVAANLEASLSIASERCDADPGRRRLLQRRLQQQATTAARAVGYYQARISLEEQQGDDCWQVQINVESGPPVRVGDVTIRLSGEARDDAAFAELINNHPLTPRSVLRHDQYQSLRDGLLRLANQRGYFDHHMSVHRLSIDPDGGRADIELEMDSGPRYRFGAITLEQDVLHDRYARRYLRFEEGSAWDSDALLETQQALLGSNYYTTVRLERGEPSMDSREVPATLHLTPRPRHAWLAGIGVSTDTGPRLRLGVEDRYVNARGQRWRADSEISPLNRAISTSYEIPLRDPVRDRFVLSSAYRYEDADSAESEQFRIGASLIRGLDSGWILTRSLDYERENFTVADQTSTTELLMPGVQLQKTRSNHPVFPRKGWKIGGSVRGTHPAISSTAAFVQTRLWGKGIAPVPGGRLIARLEGGHTAVDDVTTLPASVRFFAGGDNSLRGFDYQTLGPRDANNDVIGGRSLLLAGVEADFAVTQRWHPAVFVDAGNAFNERDDMNLRVSAGAGLRWRSPLGPIRIDVARPVDANHGWRLHLSMGPDL